MLNFKNYSDRKKENTEQVILIGHVGVYLHITARVYLPGQPMHWIV